MKTPHIAVVGSVNMDLTTFTDRIPRPGETIFGREFHLGFGGKGANQAIAARMCGADVSMVARVGDDLFGEAMLRNFASFGIDTTHILITPGVSSGVAPIFVDDAGQNRILVIKGANDRLSPDDVDASSGVLDSADMIVLQLEIPIETVYYTLRYARKRGIPAILNPAPAQRLNLAEAAHADYVIPNENEAECLGGAAVHSVDAARECARYLLRAGLRRVIVTLGEKGSLCLGPEGERHTPGYPVTPVDTTGAGDAFIGSFACFLSAGHEEVEAVSRANFYAALSTLAIGTQTSFVSLDRFEAVWGRSASAV